MWRGLMLAEEGSLEQLRKVVAVCNDPEAQGHFVTALKDAKPSVSAVVYCITWLVGECVLAVIADCAALRCPCPRRAPLPTPCFHPRRCATSALTRRS